MLISLGNSFKLMIFIMVTLRILEFKSSILCPQVLRKVVCNMAFCMGI